MYLNNNAFHHNTPAAACVQHMSHEQDLHLATCVCLVGHCMAAACCGERLCMLTGMHLVSYGTLCMSLTC